MSDADRGRAPTRDTPSSQRSKSCSPREGLPEPDEETRKACLKVLKHFAAHKKYMHTKAWHVVWKYMMLRKGEKNVTAEAKFAMDAAMKVDDEVLNKDNLEGYITDTDMQPIKDYASKNDAIPEILFHGLTSFGYRIKESDDPQVRPRTARAPSNGRERLSTVAPAPANNNMCAIDIALSSHHDRIGKLEAENKAMKARLDKLETLVATLTGATKKQTTGA